MRRIDAGEPERAYYQSNMQHAALSWTFEISNTLDGAPITAQALAGKRGYMEMRVAVKQNQQASGKFYCSHALPMTAVLNTEKCANITAAGATQANVGSNLQLTYIMLTGNDGEFVIAADVTDLEMDALAINGVRMSLNVEISSDEFGDAAAELKDTAAELDDGANEIYEGALRLSDGAAEMNGSTGEFSAAAEDVDTRIADTADDVIARRTGANVPIVSFADVRTGEIASVQFVISTLAITVEKPEDEPEEEKSVTDRFKDLSTEHTALSGSSLRALYIAVGRTGVNGARSTRRFNGRK